MGAWPRCAAAALFLLLWSIAPAQAADWTFGWLAPPCPVTKLPHSDAPVTFDKQTVRQTMRVETAGKRLRLRLSNELGTVPIFFGTIHVARLNAAGQTVPETDRLVHFAGRSGGRIPAGAPLVSDPVDLPVAASDHLVITVYYDRPTRIAGHLGQLGIAAGDRGIAAPEDPQTQAPGLVSAVEVERDASAPVIVAVGDSITEGFASTPGADMSWPQQFARRLSSDPRYHDWTVLNAGINGNRLLHDGFGPTLLARFDRDVLAVPGLTHVILLEGINDIGWGNLPESPATAEEIIAAYRQLIARSHARGVKIIGATLLPFEGAIYYRPDAEQMRETVNRWIRTSGVFDGVIDFEKAVVDPKSPRHLSAAADSGDHLHPGDQGYRMMAQAIDPHLFGL